MSQDQEYNGNYGSMEIAITVDDLPRHGDTVGSYARHTILKEFLQCFRKHNINSVTGFVNGMHIEKYPQDELILKLWVEAGNFLGNHTYSHPDFSKVSIPEYISDIEKNEPIILRHQPNSDVFRYPYLAAGETEHKQHTIEQYLKEKNYKIAPVTVDFFDFLWNTPVCKSIVNNDIQSFETLKKLYVESAIEKIQFASQISRKIFNRNIKHILLIHFGLATSLFFDEVIYTYKEMGWNFIELNRALEDPVYQNEAPVVSAPGLNFLESALAEKKIDIPSDFSNYKKKVERFSYSMPSLIMSEI